MTNYRLLILIFGIGFLLHMDLFACKCKPIKRESYVTVGLNYADIIFLGELIDSTSTDPSYSFKIFEIFKGNYKSKIIKGLATNSCSLRPTDKGLWLIYANFQKDSLIDIGMCGPSVSLKNPDGLYAASTLKFGNESEIEHLNWKIEMLNKKFDGLSSWYYDLCQLREYKLSNQIDKPKEMFDYKLLIIGFSLILNIFMLIVIIKKKKMSAANKQYSQ
jgi:hypothetical protein